MSLSHPTNNSTHISGLDPDDPMEDVVIVEDDAVSIIDFRETDGRVVQVMNDTDDEVAMLHRLLELGARCVIDSGTLLQSQTVASEFNRLANEFQTVVASSTSSIRDLTEGFVGEEGSIPKAIADLRETLEGELIKAFDPTSTTSILGKFDVVMVGLQDKFVNALAAQLDLTRPESPLSRSQEAILRSLRDLEKSVNDQLQEVIKDRAVRSARAVEQARGTSKGLGFQEVLHDAVQPMAATFGDEAEFTANTTGALKGRKVGDTVVTVKSTDAGGHAVRYALEAKDQKITKLSDVIAEIGLAMENREAQVGVAVFSSQANAPTSTPFQVFDGGRKLIVVVEKDEDGDLTQEGQLTLRLACNWARWMSIREAADVREVDGLDTETILGELANARELLNLASTVRRAHTAASNKIDEAGNQVTKICQGVAESLGRIEQHLLNVSEAGSR